MRGDKPKTDLTEKIPVGSPPHARGKVFWYARSSKLPRITPACAGKRPLTTGYMAGQGDHPRMRGEKRAEKQQRGF